MWCMMVANILILVVFLVCTPVEMMNVEAHLKNFRHLNFLKDSIFSILLAYFMASGCQASC